VSERTTTGSPLTDDDVRALLSVADRVIIARGKGRRNVNPAEVELDDLKGRSGKYRAPIVLSAGTLLVGYNAEAIAEV